MKLSWDNVTSASRIMLPVYPLFAVWQGTAYLLGDDSRTATPSLSAARAILPIPVWGTVFVAVAAVLAFGYWKRSRDTTVFVLYSAAAAYLIWAGCLAWATLTVPDSSLVGPAWPLFVCLACCASASSVARNEGGDKGGPE